MVEWVVYQWHKRWKDDYRNNKRVNHNGKNPVMLPGNRHSWTKRGEAQRQQKLILTCIQKNKEIETVRCNNNTTKQWKIQKTITKRRFQHYGMTHEPSQCLSFWKRCTGCRKSNPIQKVCMNPNNLNNKWNPKEAKSRESSTWCIARHQRESDMVRKLSMSIVSDQY